MSKLIGNEKSKLVDKHFIERLQLAVTEEAKAIVFAQHFADSRGFPKKYALAHSCPDGKGIHIKTTAQ